VVIPVGLAILGLEFAWARRWLKKAKAKAESMAQNFRNGNGKNSAPPGDPR
jgi:tellurite resistance protein TerC